MGGQELLKTASGVGVQLMLVLRVLIGTIRQQCAQSLTALRIRQVDLSLPNHHINCPCKAERIQSEAKQPVQFMRKCTPLGAYRRPVPRVLGGSQGCWCFLIDEAPL